MPLLATAVLLLALAQAPLTVLAAPRPNIVLVVADGLLCDRAGLTRPADLGYDDLGHHSVLGNNGRTISPSIDRLIDQGVALEEYYTFKVGAGFYDMSDDGNHCTDQFKLLPALLREQGYTTHALGKWDVGSIVERCTATRSGFDSWLGYYEACLSDYWYHWSPNQCDQQGPYVDLSNSSTTQIRKSSPTLNGTYNAHIFTQEAVRIIEAKAAQHSPFFMYLAYQNVHLACGSAPGNVAVRSGKHHGLQAPCATAALYGTQPSDTVKLQGAMVTELDFGLGNVTGALIRTGLWNNTVLVLVSDNGAQLDHGYNAPLKGGKHTFWEGGLRVVSFVSSPLIPESRRGKRLNGMAHSSDWYATFIEGLAGGNTSNSGPRESDGHNLWPAIISGGESPRKEVVHQVDNSHFHAQDGDSFINGVKVSSGNCDGSCGVAIRMGNWKLIVGHPGDKRMLRFPSPSNTSTAFGLTGGEREAGTDHCRALDGHTQTNPERGTYLFDLSTDLSETNNLAHDPANAKLIRSMKARLEEAGRDGPPPAYVFSNQDDEAKGKQAQCDVTQNVGYLEPGDLQVI